MNKGLKKRIAVGLFSAASMFLTITTVYAEGNYTINDVIVKYTDFYSSPSECWVYANNIYQKIWGTSFTSAFDSDDNMLRFLSEKELWLDEEHLKKYVSQAELGSTIRVCNSEYIHSNDGWGHSQIIVQKDADGFTVLEGGLNSYPYCQEKYYTWDEYVNHSWLGSRYAYIKYIKSPNAVPVSTIHVNNPFGFIDDCISTGEEIKISGWAADWDSNDTALQIQVYVGDSAESGVPCYTIAADKKREDVNEEFSGIGDFHGYEANIPVSSTGIIPVYVYAVNVGGGSDTLLGREWIYISEPEKSETQLEIDSSVVPEMSVEPDLSIDTSISDVNRTVNYENETAQTEEFVNSEDVCLSVETEANSEEVSEQTIKNSEKTDKITKTDNTLLLQ